MEGAETSLGYVAWLGAVETEETESWLVKALKDMGAIIIAKTNVPSSLMVCSVAPAHMEVNADCAVWRQAIETNNNTVGYTTNPHNRLLSSGGSSGGKQGLSFLWGTKALADLRYGWNT